MLIFRYDNTETVTRPLIQKVRQWRPQKGRAFKEIIKCSTDVMNICSSMKDSNAQAYMHSLIFSIELISKFSCEKQVVWQTQRLYQLERSNR